MNATGQRRAYWKAVVGRSLGWGVFYAPHRRRCFLRTPLVPQQTLATAGDRSRFGCIYFALCTPTCGLPQEASADSRSRGKFYPLIFRPGAKPTSGKNDQKLSSRPDGPVKPKVETFRQSDEKFQP